MDVSPVQSGSKCSSDFSIERILSDGSGRREENTESPNWLCCTRYQPPRIPRCLSSRYFGTVASAMITEEYRELKQPLKHGPTSGCRSRRSGRHARVPFTAAQAIALEAAYARAPYLAPPALRALAAALQLRDDRIKIWFQNRRARERREKSATITPPQAVTLPPTSQSALLANNTCVSRVSLDSLGMPNGFKSSVDYPHDLTSPLRIRKQNSFIDTDDNIDRPESPLDIEIVD